MGETFKTLDLIIQGLALHGQVDLDHYDAIGLHQCGSCKAFYYGNNVCDSCGWVHTTTAQPAAREAPGDLSEIQQFALGYLNPLDIQLLGDLDALSALGLPYVMLRSGRLVDKSVAEADEASLAELIAICSPVRGVQQIPKAVWDVLGDCHSELLVEFLKNCAPHNAQTDGVLGTGTQLYWDLPFLAIELNEGELAALYLKLCRPGSEIPQCVQDALI